MSNTETNILITLQQLIVALCREIYGYAGVAKSKNKIIINSGNTPGLKFTLEITK